MSDDGDDDAGVHANVVDEAEVDRTRVDEDRAAILRRRAVFLASAVAGLGLATSCGDSTPRPCLDFGRPEPAGSAEETSATGSGGAAPQPCLNAPPQPCLEIAPPPDAGVEGTDAGVDAGLPQPCLRKAPPQQPPPGPCLKVAPPPLAPCLDVAPPQGNGEMK